MPRRWAEQIKLMKTIFSMFLAFAVAASALASENPILFQGIFTIGGNTLFSVSTVEGKKAWVATGDRFDGFEVVEFAPTENTLIVSREGQRWRIPLAHAANPAASEIITRTSSVEDIFHSMEGMPIQEQGELLIRHTVAEIVSFTRAINEATSSESVVSIINDHRRLVELVGATSDKIDDQLTSDEIEQLVPTIMSRLPDAMKAIELYEETLEELRTGETYGSEENVQAAIRDLDAVSR